MSAWRVKRSWKESRYRTCQVIQGHLQGCLRSVGQGQLYVGLMTWEVPSHLRAMTSHPLARVAVAHHNPRTTVVPPMCEQWWRHISCEDRVASTEGARCKRRWSHVTSSDSVQFRCPNWRPPSNIVSSTVSSSDYLLQSVLCLRLLSFMPTTCTIYIKNWRIYARTWSSYISLLDAIFVTFTLKMKFLCLCCS